ncbi:YfcC family protein [Romboutsia sp.]|uniref:YfcC family protein n=1 Tax=Romboutsia sp. TaxID=1965302 RepID=UPI003F3412B1
MEIKYETTKKKKLTIPHTYTIIFMLIVLMAALTWVVPSGQFDTTEINGRNVVVAGTYKLVESNPQGISNIFIAPILGFVESADIIGFVLLIGGSFAIVNKTGAIQAGIGAVIRKLNGRDMLIIPISMLLFGLAGSVLGMAEELIPFYMIFVPMMCSLGYDAITGMAIIFLGSEVGFMASTTNPFTVGIAQALADVAPGSGLEYRSLIFIVLITISSLFVMKYARKVKSHPETSIIYDEFRDINQDFSSGFTSVGNLDTKKNIVLLIFGIGISIIIWGILSQEWGIANIAMVFTAIGVLGGIAGGIKQEDICDTFVAGMIDVVSAAFVIGLARGIVIIAQDGRIIDTLLNSAAMMLQGLPKPIFINLTMLFEVVMGFLIPSGSGLAALTIPILAPLSDLVDVSTQLVITAYHLGKGVISLVMPTSGVLLAALTIAKVPYSKWIKFVTPLVIVIAVCIMVFLTIGLYIGY